MYFWYLDVKLKSRSNQKEKVLDKISRHIMKKQEHKNKNKTKKNKTRHKTRDT